MNPDSSNFRAELERRLEGRKGTDRKLLFLGLLNAHLPKSGRAVLVGGALVEIYTAGAYVSGDLDVVGDRSKIGALLQAAGFQGSGRYFIRDDLELVVEVPGIGLRPTETVIEIEFERLRVPAVCVEDSIVDRLLAAKYWKSTTDWEQAILLYVAHRDSLDSAALDAKAMSNEVADSLAELKSLVARGTSG